MGANSSRRTFLKTTAAGGALAGLGSLGFLSKLPRVSAAEAKLDPNVVRLQPEIEPIVRLLEDTPREKLLEEVAARIHKGLTYREVLTALQLAGVRNVQPRPAVGFKFHAVLVVNSAHLASLSSPDEHRWLPIFWALDYFKSSQAQDLREGNWTMAPVEETAVPKATKVRKAFIAAMDDWDEAAADAAVAGLARTAGANEVFELFARYGARDFRSIGHKAIFVSNSWRTLQCIGWRHAEPVLRSLAYALQMHEGSNPAKRQDAPDMPWRRNIRLAATIRKDWLAGKLDGGVTREMMATLRTGSEQDTCKKVVELLGGGAAAQSIWDGILLGAGELLARQPGIIGLHAVTTSNALRYAYTATASDETRKMMLLQNAAFLPMFRKAMAGRGKVRDFELDKFPAAEEGGADKAALETIFREISADRTAAAGRILKYLDEQGDPKQLIDAARVLVFLKGSGTHDYKFSSAVLEDYYQVSPQWRNRYLASGAFNLRGSGGRDNALVARTRAALKG